MISGENKKAVIESLQADKKDTGSPAVQVGILTERIKEITEHLKTNKKDHAARRGLLQMVGQRRRLLRYISDKDSQAYLDLIGKLGIRK
ncbi:MAG: 30S ribosomal protein S15 [Candidatus Saccharimonadales bacterium]